MYPEEAYVRATLDAQEGVARGWSVYYGQGTDRNIRALEELEKAKKRYEELSKSMPADEQWKIMRQDDELFRSTGGFASPEMKHPLDLIKKAMEETRKNMDFARTSSAGQLQQAMDTYETKSHIITPIKRLEKLGV